MTTVAEEKPDGAPDERFELVELAGGVKSLRSLANGQTFHPVIGPVAEARAVHVAGTRLVERANAHGDREHFFIWDVGLGAAANALTAAEALVAGYQEAGNIILLSFDHSLDALSFALANREALVYPIPYADKIEEVLEGSLTGISLPLSERGAIIMWQAHVQDFPSLLAEPEGYGAPHAIFYDPYSPTANPEMWTLETFTALYGHLHPKVPCLLTTYTRSTAVRVTLLLAGFHVGVGGATGEKDETTVATNTPDLLDAPLTRRWLEKKVYASTNAAPLRAASGGYTRGPISEEDYARLQAHAQFVTR